LAADPGFRIFGRAVLPALFYGRVEEQKQKSSCQNCQQGVIASAQPIDRMIGKSFLWGSHA
jgi:hypothetical protein